MPARLQKCKAHSGSSMKNVWFYAEYAGACNNQTNGNVVAVFVGNGIFWSSGTACYEGMAAVYNQLDSPTGVALSYLRQNCKSVSERQAWEIHLRLFERLVG
jgi:hypothetical protein